MAARRLPNDQLAALLTEADWSAGELARAVNALGSKNGLRLRYDRTAVAHWLDGSRPRRPVPDLVAQALSIRIGRTVTAAETGLVRNHRADPLHRVPPAVSDPVQRLLALCQADTEPARRAVINRTVFITMTPQAVVWDDTEPPRPGAGLPGATARRVAAMAEVFADLTERYGGGHARTCLVHYITDEVGPLLQGTVRTSPDTIEGAGLGAVAHLAHRLGRMTVDAHLPNLAYQYHRVALDLARQAHDRTTWAVTLGALSSLAHQLDHVAHATQWAQAALDASGPDTPPHVRAFLHATRAVALARGNQRSRAMADLAAAEPAQAMDSIPEASSASLELVSALHHHRAETLLILGDQHGAVDALTSCLHSRTPEHHRAIAITHAKLAEVLLATGAVDAAISHCRECVDHYAHLNSSRARQALQVLYQSLSPYRRHRHVREVRQLIRQLVRDEGKPSPRRAP
ncbi:hypothetical protein ACIHCQ_34480 [Streptomyces sp. NPDC052236]|uniref:hypothetical protein n=1 Tax=Streptomyces sp. NPDC052236 TaxID=3365686 RepID=UPI0037CF4FBB